MSNSPHRVLLIAEAANPEQVSVPLVGWSHAEALSRVADVHLVTQIRNRDAIVRFGWQEGKEFSSIDSEAVAKLLWRMSNVLRGGGGKGWTTVTAMKVPSYLYFERLLWQRFRADLKAGKYDVVHRLTPLSPTMPSFLAAKLKRLGIPHVIGPLNGGVPWPREFDAERRAEKEWLSYVRGAYRLVPGQGSMRRSVSAIVCGSSDTFGEFAGTAGDKLVYMPENAVDPARFPELVSAQPRLTRKQGPLRVAFIGRLVPYKGVDMLLEAAAPLLRERKLFLDIIGDGPEGERLRNQAVQLELGESVEFSGWVDHEALSRRLERADVLGFPSIREFGGGVVLEAMALGLVPVVVAYGGPKDLVTDGSGILLPLGSRAEIVAALREALSRLEADRELTGRLGAAAKDRVRRYFTWDRKAAHTLEVYDWVLGRRDKPDWGMPYPDG